MCDVRHMRNTGLEAMNGGGYIITAMSLIPNEV